MRLLFKILIAREKTVAHQSEGVTWHPEFGGWMIESTPSRPYVSTHLCLYPFVMTHYRDMFLSVRRLSTQWQLQFYRKVSALSESLLCRPLFVSFLQTNYAADLLRVERNMVLRRRRLLSVLCEDEIAPTVTCFPMLGVGDFIDSPLPFDSSDSKSVYLPDYIINPHPR